MTDYAIQQVVNALSAGSLYALMAVGLAMVFGILRLINFAHGDLMMVAAYFAFFLLGAKLPLAVAGLLYAVQAGQINPYIGFTPVLKAFIAAVIGGFGSIAGAVLGGYVLGFLEVLVTSLAGIGDLLPAGSVPPEFRSLLQHVLPSELASWRDAVVFVVLILVLLVRPQGILGKPQREGEL